MTDKSATYTGFFSNEIYNETETVTNTYVDPDDGTEYEYEDTEYVYAEGILGDLNLEATFSDAGAEVSGTADNFSLVSLDYDTGTEENLGAIDGSLNISGTIVDIDLENDLETPSMLAVSGTLSGSDGENGFTAVVSGDMGTTFIQDVNGEEMIMGYGTLDVETDWEGYQQIEDGAAMVATKN